MPVLQLDFLDKSSISVNRTPFSNTGINDLTSISKVTLNSFLSFKPNSKSLSCEKSSGTDSAACTLKHT